MQALDPNDPALRPCGECFACCKWLGINELKKPTGKACSHLDAKNGKDKMCQIYATRPEACAKYSCAWRGGLGEDEFRPDRCGMLISYYRSEAGIGVAATILTFDPAKSGTIVVGKLHAVIDALIGEGFQDIRVINPHSRTVIHFHKGIVRRGQLIPRESNDPNYEGLTFHVFDPPIGKFSREKIS